jgi:hypothetical protein
MRRRFFVVMAAFSFAAFTSSCDSGSTNDDSAGKACGTLADCSEGSRCAEGVCSTEELPCEFDTECALDEYCAEGLCAGSACAGHSDCVTGTICLSGSCRDGCRDNDDCASAEVCHPVTKVCSREGCTTGTCPRFQACDEETQPASCEYTGDCESDEVCVAYGSQVGDGEEYICSSAERKCVIKPPCGTDADCRVGEICEPRNSDGRMVCRRGCRDDGHCRSNEICDLEQGGICVSGCATDADCETVVETGPNYCIDKICVPGCNTATDCNVSGQVCRGDPQICQACRRDGDCTALQFCDFTEGATETEMMNGALGLCVPLPPTCPDDAYGDNHAQDRTYAVTVFPFAAEDDAAPYYCRENPSGEWFSFAAGTGDVIEVNLVYASGSGNLDLALRQTDGQELVSSADPPTTDDGTETIIYGVGAGRPFLVQVRGTVLRDNVSYDLSINVTTPGACRDDALEPNNAAIDAVTADAGTDYRDLQVCGGDSDFYLLTAGANQVVSIAVEAPVNLGDIDAVLYNDAGGIVAQATTGADLEELVYETSDAEQLTLEIRVAGGVGNVDYSFEWNQRDNVCTDGFEQNDTCAAATRLAGGVYTDLAICSDRDWYVFDLLPLETLNIKTIYDPAIAAGDLDVVLYGPNDCQTQLMIGSEETIPSSTAVQEVVSHQAQQGGEFYLSGALFAGISVPYTLEVEIVPGPVCSDDSGEPNSDAAGATALVRADVLAGNDNILSGLRICDTDSDWYQISLQDGDVIEWIVDFQQSQGDLDVYLLGSDGVTVITAGTSSTDDETVTYTVNPTEAGVYYLRVEGKFATRTDYRVLTYLNGVGPVDPDCPDSHENNDTQAAAAAVTSGVYDLLICGNPRDDDWFRTFVSAGERITVDLTFAHANGNIDLYLYEEGRTQTVVTSTTSTNVESVSFTTAKDQFVEYQIRTSSSVISNPYQMTVTLGAAATCVDDANEPNDDAASAAAVTAPSLNGALMKCEDDEDWFKVDLVTGEMFEAFLNFDGDRADLDLYLYDVDQVTELGSGVTTDDDESIIYTPMATGTYFMKVVSKNRARLGYDLLIYRDSDGDNVVEGPEDRNCPDVFENNDIKSVAAAIPVGTYNDLLLCWESGAFGIDSDYYSVFVPDGATITIDILFSQSEGDLQARLYRGPNSSIAVDQGVTNTDNETVTATNTGGAETYILYIYGHSTGFRSYYGLDIQLTFPGACADDATGQSDMMSATDLSTSNFDALTLCEGTEDWFKVPTGTQSIVAHADFANRLGNIDMELVDANGVVATSSTDTGLESLDEALTSTTDYWLRVFPKDGSFLRTEYDLWISLDGASPSIEFCPDAFERNDTVATASSLDITNDTQYVEMVACGLDKDWYAVNLIANVTYDFDVFYDSNASTNLGIEVLDSSVMSVHAQDGMADDELYSFMPSSSGTHYLGVTNSQQGSGAYDLLFTRATAYSASQFQCPEDTANEPNDNVFQPATLSGALPLDLPLGGCGNDDYFAFTAPSASPITVSTRFDASKLNLAMQVSTAAGASVGIANNDMGNRESITFTPVAGEDYIVAVIRNPLPMSTMASNGPYFLHINN